LLKAFIAHIEATFIEATELPYDLKHELINNLRFHHRVYEQMISHVSKRLPFIILY
jgi:hypothetical protein